MEKIKLSDGKWYTPVSERIKELARRVKEGEIDSYNMTTETELIDIGNKFGWRCQVTLDIISFNTVGSLKFSKYTGDGFKIQDQSQWGSVALMVAETIARGRACAAAGIGIDDIMVSVEEVMASETGTSVPKDPTEAALKKLDNISKEVQSIREDSGILEIRSPDEIKPPPVDVDNPTLIPLPSDYQQVKGVIKDKMPPLPGSDVIKMHPIRTDAAFPPIYTEEELREMGTTDSIYSIIRYYNIDVSVIDGRKTNLRLRSLILEAQEARVKEENQSLPLERVPEEAPQETKPIHQDGETSVPVDDIIKKVTGEEPGVELRIGSATNYLDIEVSEKTPRSDDEYLSMWTKFNHESGQDKESVGKRMRAMGFLDKYKSIQIMLERGARPEINDLINSFQEK